MQTAPTPTWCVAKVGILLSSPSSNHLHNVATVPSAWWNSNPHLCACSIRLALDIGTVIHMADFLSRWADAKVASSLEWNVSLSKRWLLSVDWSSGRGSVIYRVMGMIVEWEDTVKVVVGQFTWCIDRWWGWRHHSVFVSKKRDAVGIWWKSPRMVRHGAMSGSIAEKGSLHPAVA